MLGSHGFKAALVGGVCAMALAGGAAAQTSRTFNVPAGDLQAALDSYAQQAGVQLLYRVDLVKGMQSRGAQGQLSTDDALTLVLADTGLQIRRHESGAVAIVQSGEGGSAPQGGSAATGGATVEALIVTAQKREEDIQDVPIAISAFSQEDLTRSQVAGGPDLITQVPNMTFTKTNFSSYSIQIRGIGTQAISATTDPAVAVAFNNTPFIRNRFFEQEFYDLQRVEVLRGPQGTLYGRNATAGVVNLISAKPKFYTEAKASGDIGNYNSSRIEGMVNVPLVEDVVALRLAGAWTKRDGYAFNETSGQQIDGRDLWSTRVSLRVSPNDRIDVNLIWEHFEEDDDRLRSGKQLCNKDVVTDFFVPAVLDFPDRHFELDGYFAPFRDAGQGGGYAQSVLSQGCARHSLYSDSFDTVNGLSVPYYQPAAALGLPIALVDPYVSAVQAPDLRVIESSWEPEYRARSNIGELQATFDLTDNLTLTSETAYATDSVYSLQDFNRFTTASRAWLPANYLLAGGGMRINDAGNAEWCDPQLGCSDRLIAVDVSTAKATQFSQEFRLGSDFDGPFNFSLGSNFLRADSEDKYYVFINSISLLATVTGDETYTAGETDNTRCSLNPLPGDPLGGASYVCINLEQNSIAGIEDTGHNYFLSKNPYKLISYAVFGEAYYNVTESLKITGGLRWTVDKKEAPRIPTWIASGAQTNFYGTIGYPVYEVERQEWREPTGRLTIDWKPDLSLTDETLLYASYAHGYKAGGSNPPLYAGFGVAKSLTRPKTFDAEFVDAYEVGAKNTLLDGRMTLNLAAFYYDYEGYQISEIVDRSAFNRNFDATVWGVELEADWRPLENLRFGVKGGYEKTRIADGQEAIDLMDRTAGDPYWVLVRPFPTRASSCILPAWLFAVPGDDEPTNLGSQRGGGPGGCELAYEQGVDPVSGVEYEPYPTGSRSGFSIGRWPQGENTPNAYPGWDPATAPNNGEGIAKPLGGNELPNAPNWTATLTADYTVPLAGEWLVNLHTDLHWQAESWWRIFNDHEHAKLDEYFTMNLAAIFTNEAAGWNVMAYVKNVTDETAITGAFLNSDDTGLTTNVFLTEPRLYGLRVTKAWDGGPLLGSLGRRHDGVYPFTLELGGQVQKQDAPTERFRPAFIDEFSPAIDPTPAQDQDLDWGDGREVKLTYAPDERWKVSLGLRYGQANRADRRILEGATSYTCVYEAPCDENDLQPFINYGKTELWDHEDHTLVDFLVGRDFGLGLGDGLESTISGGLRYAQFTSRTDVSLGGTPDWNPPYQGWLWVKYGFTRVSFPATRTEYEAEASIDRTFEGAGPVLSWEASQRVAEGDFGRLGLDWSVSGGVMFGKQSTSIEGSAESRYYSETAQQWRLQTEDPDPVTFEDIDIHRSDSVTVPTAALSLGLSYKVGGFAAGAGYRWERYYDAIDGGFMEAEDHDRTIDGPYLKLSVGFGG